MKNKIAIDRFQEDKENYCYRKDGLSYICVNDKDSDFSISFPTKLQGSLVYDLPFIAIHGRTDYENNSLLDKFIALAKKHCKLIETYIYEDDNKITYLFDRPDYCHYAPYQTKDEVLSWIAYLKRQDDLINYWGV